MTTAPTTSSTSARPEPAARPAGRHRAESEYSARLSTCLSTLRAALTTAGDEVPAWLSGPAREGLDRVEERLELGVDHTVVALFGGTGSGKSSLFNALTRLDFADVGVRRPTTAVAAACSWGDDAEALLDFLGVAPKRRIRRESLLDAHDEDELAGLVLLDVPDYDSVTTDHALQVDRLVPVADILLWVVDPQKYADAALHEGYLRELGARQEDMLVLVNQVDTVPEAGVQPLLDDVHALLAADGLTDVEVLPVSAVRGDNMARLREILRGRVGIESNAARTADAELDAITGRLRGAVAPERVAHDAEVDAAAANALMRASGATAVADSIRTGLARLRPPALAHPGSPAVSEAEAVRSSWLARTTPGLPEPWVRAVDAAASRPAPLASAAGEAAAAVELPAGRRAGIEIAWWLGLLALVAGVAWGVVAAATGGAMGGAGGAATAVIAPAVRVVLGIVLLVWSRAARRRRAAREAEAYAARVRERLDGVVAAELATPADNVLRRHEVLQAALGL
ncbi:GTPase [Actinomyces radicidentis]|uniref:GTPase n=1 Tax=Actinomyces radicidentis TaxID=111015 RepID=UPI0028E666A7|nr:GTPase [Actinomyces radicidentis]